MNMQKQYSECCNCRKAFQRCCCNEICIQTGRFRSHIDKTMYKDVDMCSVECLQHVIDQTLFETEYMLKDYVNHNMILIRAKVHLAIAEFGNQQKTENWSLKRDLKLLKCVEKENKDIIQKLNMLKNERDNEWCKRVQYEEKLKHLEAQFSKLK